MRIGIDIGGTTIKLGIVEEGKRITARKVIDTEADRLPAEQVLVNTAEAAKALLAENGFAETDCEFVGIACPGTCDSKEGKVPYSNNLNWKDVPLTRIMTEHLQIPCALANDADAAALGEVIAGAARGKSNAVMLTIGTGVGGGVIIDGKIFTGALLGGCELGHMLLKRGGRLCTCGRRGCLEAYASASGLIRTAKKKLKEDPISLMALRKMYDGDAGKLNAKIIYDACKQGNRAAEKTVAHFNDCLSEGIANVVNVFRPEVVIIGGGVSAQGEYLTDALKKRVGKLCFGGECGQLPDIVCAELGNDAGIIGAANLR